MEIYVGGRGTGKTAKLIKTAYATDSTILVHSSACIRHVEDLAKEMKCPVRVALASSYFDSRGRSDKPVLIDNLELVMHSLFHTRIYMATINGWAYDVESANGAQFTKITVD